MPARTDKEPTRLVDVGRRFARGDPAGVLREHRLVFHPFNAGSEIADQLLQRRA
jgi:hypothetical protein